MMIRSLSPALSSYSITPATATPKAPTTPAPKNGALCIATLVLCVFAVLDVPVVAPDVVDLVCVPDVGLGPADEVLGAVALPVGSMLLLLVCCAFVKPAVITTGINEYSEADSVSVANAGTESLPAVRAEPDAAAMQIAWVVPMSWQLRDSVPL